MQVVIYSFGAERKKKMAIYEKQNYGFLTERLYNVSLNLFSVGKNTYKKPWHWESKPVEYYTLHYVLEGTGSYSVLGNEFHTKAGDAVLIYPNSLATIDTFTIPYIFHWVNFNGAVLKDLLKNTDFTKESPIMHLPDCLVPHIEKMTEKQGLYPYQQSHMIGCLYLLFSEIIERSSGSGKNEDYKKLYVHKAFDYISENYYFNISVTDIAGHVGLSRSHLYRLFMEELNMSPLQYLTQYRLEKSLVMLKETDLSVSDIALRAGFESAYYFSRVFSKYMGQAPSVFRKQKDFHLNHVEITE